MTKRSRKSSRKQILTSKGKTRHLYSTLDKGTYIAFDIESTGGNPERNGITEICAFKVKEGKIVDRFYSLVNPLRNIPPIVRRMTGITNRMVKDAPLIEEVMPKFVEFIGDGVLVSHNTIGDMKFIRYFAEQTTGATVLNYFLCTHLLTEKLMPEAPDKSLKGLSEHLSLTASGQFHRAEADAELTLKLFEHLCGILKKDAAVTIAQSIKLQGDYESTIRLGWDLNREQLRNLPSEPGVFFLKNSKGKTVFLSSAKDLAGEVKSMAKLHFLPKQLIKSVALAKEVSFETTSGLFSAIVKESQCLSENKIRYTPADWHQRVAQFVYTIPEANNKIKLVVGALKPGATWVLGPIKSGRDIAGFMESVAVVFDKKPSKKALTFTKAEGRLVVQLLRGDLGELWFSSLLSYPLGLLGKFSQAIGGEQARKHELRQIVLPKELRKLHECTGVLAVPGQGSWELYSVVAGVPKLEAAFEGHVDEGVVKSKCKNLSSRIRKQRKAFGKSPLKDYEAHAIGRLFWWLQFGPRRNENIFLAVDEI